MQLASFSAQSDEQTFKHKKKKAKNAPDFDLGAELHRVTGVDLTGIRPRNKEAEQKRTEAGFKARRWVVERSHSWFNCYRKILVSFEKTEASFVTLLYLASALTSWRQTLTICGYDLRSKNLEREIRN
jgi:hypothetical protein